MLICNTCNEAKPLTAEHFYWYAKEKRFMRKCKACRYLYQKEWKKKNAKTIKEKRAKYNKENAKRILAQQREYAKNKRRTNPIFRLRRNISRAVRAGITKNGSISKTLSYSINDLKAHLEGQFESWMNWNNYGAYNNNWNDDDMSTWTWNIDHIIPQSDLPYDSEHHLNFFKCWALGNLRPFPAKQNCVDGLTRVRHNGAL